MKICPKCNKKYKDDKDFCRECGTELVKKEINKKKILIVILSIIGVFLLLSILNKPTDYNSIKDRVVELTKQDKLLDKFYGDAIYVKNSNEEIVTGYLYGYKDYKINSFGEKEKYNLTFKYFVYDVKDDKIMFSEGFEDHNIAFKYATAFEFINPLKKNGEIKYNEEYIDNQSKDTYYIFTIN